MDKNSNTLLDKMIPFLGRPSKRWYAILGILLVITAIGFYAFVRQEIDGHDITGMRNHVVWGVYIVNFIFLLGLSYAGTMISGIFHLGRIQWARPLIRMIEFLSFVTLIIAPIYILMCIGRLDRMFYLIIHARIQSPIIWDVIAIATDIIFCLAYLYMTQIKDFALLRDNSEKLNVSNWRKKLYKVLSFGYTGSHKQEMNLDQAINILAAIIIPTSIVAYSLLAWLFGMNLRTGWNNSILAPYFVLTAVYSGLALVIFVMIIIRKIYNLKDYITNNHVYVLSFGLLLLSMFFGYFSFSEFITSWYNTQTDTAFLLSKLVDFDQFGYYFYYMIIVAVFLPLFVVGIPKLRTVNNIMVTSFLILTALWVKSYLLIVPILETPYITIVDPRPEYLHYSATWIEWSLSAAGLAFAVVMLMFLTKLAPILPISEMKDKRKFRIFGISSLFETKEE